VVFVDVVRDVPEVVVLVPVEVDLVVVLELVTAVELDLEVVVTWLPGRHCEYQSF
jgi:hypothetical protein